MLTAPASPRGGSRERSREPDLDRPLAYSPWQDAAPSTWRGGPCGRSRQAGLDCFRGCAGAREHLGLPSSDSSLVVAPAYRAGLAPVRGGSCERSRREGFLRPLRTRRCVGSTSSVRCRRGGSFERSHEADLDPLRRRSAEQSRLGCLPRDSGESNASAPCNLPGGPVERLRESLVIGDRLRSRTVSSLLRHCKREELVLRKY